MQYPGSVLPSIPKTVLTCVLSVNSNVLVQYINFIHINQMNMPDPILYTVDSFYP